MDILVTGSFIFTEEQLNEIHSLGFKITYIQDERHKLEIDVSKFSVVICNSLFMFNDIEDFISLKMIQVTSAGLDRLPLEQIKRKNILLCNAKNVYSIPIAEFVVLKILEVYKKTRNFYIQEQSHQWNKIKSLGELTNKKVAIIGYGDIGFEISKRLKNFGCEIIAVDIVEPKKKYIDSYINVDDFDDNISLMDIIVLSLPLNQYTFNYFSKQRMTKLKDFSIIINISRGDVLNEDDLVDCLANNNTITAILDVFSKEPLTNKCLWEMSNIYITPHIAYSSTRNSDRMYKVIIENLTKFINKNVL